jgi:DNA-binding MarR family transcriptional regulator
MDSIKFLGGEEEPVADEWASGAEQIQSAVEALLRFHTSRRMHLSRAAAAGVPLNDSAYVVLRYLSRRGPSSAAELAKNTSTQLATTYRAIDQLLADGYVVRVHDRPRSPVALSPSGEEAIRRLSLVTVNHLDAVLAAWSPADRQQFATLLTAFVRDAAAMSDTLANHSAGQDLGCTPVDPITG